ncbi:CocE/NonD family hydrolase [Caenimonas sedimenti]|uniref:CocE/NonD family hydrolase n=2 Tax=Caenimonas sedimenti TaxID=2596921 RepID=A0A562ZXB1_9BURK|nr:CocE/NonD family hydrolase [Caenimonas sedimenti]TWO73252.1 CocE/NonD family hydrolase [Caenimonas sedimenti]
MVIEWDAPITMDDGLVLRADIYRPVGGGEHPVLMTHGPYAKGLSFQEGFAFAWMQLAREHPEALEGSSNKYQSWETPDPEIWTRDWGYVCVRVDSRGAGRSPGYLDCFSPRETLDFKNCIEWAGVRPWSNGKVGLTGISYYAMNQWQVAALRPKHLAAICPFEGASDLYRDGVRHGGILTSFWIRWYPAQVSSVQHGLGARGRINHNTGEPIAGPETLSPEEMARNIADLPGQHLGNRFATDAYFAERTPRLEDIEVPVFSRGNWGGIGLHLHGNTEAFLRVGSRQKWLEMHGDTHWTEYYTPGGRALMRRFFDHFLKGEDNGWDREPAVQLSVRLPNEKFLTRKEGEWPLARTQWTRHYLDAASSALVAEPGSDASVEFRGFSQGHTFYTPPMLKASEITGPVAAKVFIASSTRDADIFLSLRAYAPNGRELLFQGASEPNVPLAFGWLRASHRKLDAARSLPYRPWHPHDEEQPLVPGEVHELDIEIWPTSIVLPPGFRLALTVGGEDYDHQLPGPLVPKAPPQYGGIRQTGCSIHVHDVSGDRPPEVFDGTATLYTGGKHASFLLLPVIPAA